MYHSISLNDRDDFDRTFCKASKTFTNRELEVTWGVNLAFCTARKKKGCKKIEK